MDQIVSDNGKLSQAEVKEAYQWTAQDVFDTSILGEAGAALDALHPLKKRLLRLGVGKWFIGYFKQGQWKEPLPFYAWRCRDCGQVVYGYPHGYLSSLYCCHCYKPLAV